MKQYLKSIVSCLLFFVVLLAGCNKQPAEGYVPVDPAVSTGTTQPQADATEAWALSQITLPQQTESVTQSTEDIPVSTQSTELIEQTEDSELDEDELPPVPVG